MKARLGHLVRGREEGSSLILICFYSMLALLLVLVVTAASSLYLERKRLFSLADGAALVGAEAFDLSDVRVDGGTLSVDLDPAAVHDAVAGYLRVAPTGAFEDLRIERATSDDGRSATVQLSAMWRPPVLTLLLPEGVRLDVTSIARSVFG
jgi:hypothetical protein